MTLFPTRKKFQDDSRQLNCTQLSKRLTPCLLLSRAIRDDSASKRRFLHFWLWSYKVSMFKKIKSWRCFVCLFLLQLKMILIKCCDISNEVRPMAESEPWLDCLLEEYFNQSDREKAEGLPVAPFMDREKVTKPTAQIGFIKFVLVPLFDAVARLFPQIDGTMVESLRQAHHHYERMKQEDDAKVMFSQFETNQNPTIHLK